MELVASDRKLVELTVNDGAVVKRNAKGTFTVPDAIGRSIVRSGEFGVAGTNLRGGNNGFRCTSCWHLSVFKEKCGRCGSTELKEE